MTDPRLPERDDLNVVLFDAAVRHSIALERFKAGTVNRVLTLLEEDVYPDIVASLAERLERIRTSGVGASLQATERGRDLMSSTLGLLKGGARAAYDEIEEDLKQLAVDEADWQIAIANARLERFDITFKTPSPGTLRQLVTASPFEGKLAKEWFAALAPELQTELVRVINIGISQGESSDQIIRRVRGTARNQYTDGVLEIGRKRARIIVRNAIANVSVQTREETYRENSEFISGVQIVAVLDNRTTPICRGYDGKVYPVGEGPRPPFHWNCRTTTVPVVKGWRELGLKDPPEGTRASMTGQVPASMNYDSWLRTQSVEFQDEVLGKAKADIFRRGTVTLDRYIDRRGRELNLTQLRKLERQIKQSSS